MNFENFKITNSNIALLLSLVFYKTCISCLCSEHFENVLRVSELVCSMLAHNLIDKGKIFGHVLIWIFCFCFGVVNSSPKFLRKCIFGIFYTSDAKHQVKTTVLEIIANNNTLCK